jgi:hypothetical protein
VKLEVKKRRSFSPLVLTFTPLVQRLREWLSQGGYILPTPFLRKEISTQA